MPSLTKVQSGFMEAQGALPLSSGTAAAPGLKFDDHAGTGMFSPSTGEIAFSTSSHSQAVTFKTDGKVGIGIANPVLKTHIYNTANADVALIESTQNFATIRFKSATNTSGPTIGIDGAGGLQLDQKDTSKYIAFAIGSERLRITSDGLIGIGAFNNTSYDTNAQNLLLASSGNTGMTIRSAGSTPFAMIHFADGTTGNSQKRAGRIVYQHDGDNLMFNTADTERFRLSGDGKVYFGNFGSAGAKSYILKETSGDYKFNIFASESTTDNRIITFNSRSNVEALRISANAIPRVGINATGPNAILTVGPISSPAFYRGTVAIKATQDDNNIDACLYLEEASGAEGYTLSVASNGELNFHNSGASTATLKLGDDNLVTAQALHVTHNITPTSGRGVEIFEASAGVGQVQSFNRTGGSWDELRIKGSEVKIYTGTSNGLGLDLGAVQSTLYGTSDGILNLDSTNAAGSFMRFKQSGSTKAWVGSAEGMGGGFASPDQDDLGLRALGGIRFSTNGGERIRLEENGSIRLTPEGSTSNPNARIDTSGDNLRLLTMKDGSGGCGFIIETQHSGTLGERFRISTDGVITINTVPATNNNANQAVLFQTAAGAINGGSGLLYNPAEDALKVNGNTISSNAFFGAGAGPLMLAVANYSSTQYIKVSNKIEIKGNVGINEANPSVSLDLASNTDAVSLPTGTTAQRPAGTDAYIRKNSTNNALEFYNGTNWVEIITDYFPTGSTTLG